MSSETGGEPRLPLAELVQVDEACDQFEAAWRSDKRPDLATYLAQASPVARPRLFRELLGLEVEYQRERGYHVDPNDYRGRFPDFSAIVDAVFGQAEPGAKTQISAHDYSRPHAHAGKPGESSGVGVAVTHTGDPLPRADLGRDALAALRTAGYEILGELGRGGMGVVYLAHKVALNRRCALKMILAGSHGGGAASARFRAEAETIARLQHPDIVQIYHVGDIDGMPYFELEYLPGGSLDKQLNGTPWSASAAAQMVEVLSLAIAEAHRRGIVHRDLKPANILLDGAKRPKVADFGLAKMLDSGDGLTKTHTVLGSPSYMAPEQAAGESRLVGPTTDVYALGAILYELLTGRPPFRAATAVETLVQVRDSEPIAPSRFQPGLPRAAETICLKCLEKEPGRRYPTADALAEDLHRFRSGESILAHPAPAWEQAWRWTRQRPAMAAAVSVAAVAVTVFLAGVAYYNARLRAEARKSQAAEAAALAQRNLALNAFNQLVYDVQERLGNTAATRAMRRSLLDTAIQGLDEIARGTEGSTPDLSRAVAHVKLGEIYLQIGRATDARRQLELALHLADRLGPAASTDLAVAECRRDALAGLGAVQMHDRRLDSAKDLLRQVVTLSEQVERIQPRREGARRRLNEAYLELGRAHSFAGERRAAESWFQKMHDQAERWVQDEPDNLLARDLLASSQRKLADERKLVDDNSAARVYYLRAIKTGRELVAAEPGNVIFKRHLAIAADDLAGVAQNQGEADEARSLFAEAERLFAEMVAADPEDLESQFRLIRVESRFATLERDELQFTRAAALLRIAATRRQQLEQQSRFGGGAPTKTLELHVLESECAACEFAPQVLANLEAAHTRPTPEQCMLLSIRTRAMNLQANETEALAAAAALCEVTVNTAEDFYIKARALAGCVRFLDDSRWPAPPTPARQSQRRRCVDQAMTALTQAIAMGVDNLQISGFEEDLAPLRSVPAYQKLADRLRDPNRSPRSEAASATARP